MTTVFILLTGLAIVIGGILVFRLHAFVALILAGLTVAFLTPSELVIRSGQLEGVVRNADIDSQNLTITVPEPLSNVNNLVVAEDPGEGLALRIVATVPDQQPTQGESESELIYRFEFNDDEESLSEAYRKLYLLSSKDAASAANNGKLSFMSRLTTALGSYCGKLAILIVAASIIGRCLLDSGAADRIVKSALNAVGEKNAPAAFAVSGFTLSIPVFFDTVFYLMVPLAKALRLRTGGNYLLYVLSIVAGGTMAHSLVPPTPGPLFIAEAFDVSITAMIFGGSVVGLISASVGMLYAMWINSRNVLSLPDSDGIAEPDRPTEHLAADAGENIAANNDSAPGLLTSLVPILLPILLISLGALVTKTQAVGESTEATWRFASQPISESLANAITVCGEKNFALLISAAFAVVMYVRTKRPSKQAFSAALQDAVTSAGTIILVTAAGGAFGMMMRQTSVAELLEGLPGTSPVMVVVAAFLVTTAVRTAQGSSTVAMITAAGIFGGLVTSGAANVDPLYVALAVGCGSKPISWMNDSGFWVITRMSGMTEKEGLKYITPMTALAGLTGLVVVILGVILFP